MTPVAAAFALSASASRRAPRVRNGQAGVSKQGSISRDSWGPVQVGETSICLEQAMVRDENSRRPGPASRRAAAGSHALAAINGGNLCVAFAVRCYVRRMHQFPLQDTFA